MSCSTRCGSARDERLVPQLLVASCAHGNHVKPVAPGITAVMMPLACSLAAFPDTPPGPGAREHAVPDLAVQISASQDAGSPRDAALALLPPLLVLHIRTTLNRANMFPMFCPATFPVIRPLCPSRWIGASTKIDPMQRRSHAIWKLLPIPLRVLKDRRSVFEVVGSAIRTSSFRISVHDSIIPRPI
mgnify:CR=1 FL=1